MRFNHNVARLLLVQALAAGLFLALDTRVCAAANSSPPAQAPLSPAQAKAAAAKATLADNAVKTAAAALRKEFEAHQANDTAPLRTECNFFKENSNPDITPKAIIAGLNRGYGSIGADLYVRWQLLSGLDDTVDDADAPALLSVYRDSPAPPMRPGLEPDQKAQFRQVVSQMKEADAANINAQFTKTVQAWETAVKPYTQYRDALAKKLPVNYGLVLAEFRDAVERASRGVDADEPMKKTIENCKTWATGDAKVDELQEIADDVTSLLRDMGDTKATAQADWNFVHTVAYARPRSGLGFGTGIGTTGNTANSSQKKKETEAEATFPPKYDTEVAWDAKSKSLEWKTGSAKFASREELVDLQKMLLEQIEKLNKSNANSTAGAS